MYSALMGAQGADTFVANPIADAYVTAGPGDTLSGKNFGAAGALAIAAAGLPGGEFQSVLRFDLSGARSSFDSRFGAGQWTLESVTLKLTSSPHDNPIFNAIATGQFRVSLMQNNSWVEGTGTGGRPATVGLSYTSLQGTFVDSSSDQSVGKFAFGGGSSGANEYRLELSSVLLDQVQSGGELSLRLFPADNAVSYLFSSRSGSGSTPPELIIVATPEPGIVGLSVAGLVMLSVWASYGKGRSSGVVM